MPKRPRSTLREKDLAKIHIAKQTLALLDDDYRAIIARMCGGKTSAADLTGLERARLLTEFKRLGWKEGGGPDHGAKPDVVEPYHKLIDKIEALLADGKYPWSYAHTMARRMFGVDNLRFCHAGQLHRIVAALTYNQQRRSRRDDRVQD